MGIRSSSPVKQARKRVDVIVAEELDRLFHPSSLAVIGASRDDDRGGGYLLHGLVRNQFTGTLYPVNPRESELLGLKCYPSVRDIPGEVDVAVIAVPARIVPRIMAECGQKGVKFAIVHSAGFSEVDAAGKELENEILQVAQQYGTRVIGPNCMGVCHPSIGLNTVIPKIVLGHESGPVAFIGQSGWASENFIQRGLDCGLRFSKVISIGNQSDLTIEDFLRYLAHDTETGVIAAYIEGIKHGREFFQLLKQVSVTKPVIVWKGGKSQLGARAVASHTASLAGNSAVFDSALRQSGVTSAQNLDELLDMVAGFVCPVLPRGNKVGVLVEAGGGAVASLDIAAKLGLELPTLSPAAQQALAAAIQDRLPASSSRSNPVDLVWVPLELSAQIFFQCSRIMLREVDAVLMLTYGMLDESYVSGLVRLRDEMGKTIIVVPGWPILQKPGMSLLVRKGVPVFTIPERGLKVLSAMVSYANYLATHKK